MSIMFIAAYLIPMVTLLGFSIGSIVSKKCCEYTGCHTYYYIFMGIGISICPIANTVAFICIAIVHISNVMDKKVHEE